MGRYINYNSPKCSIRVTDLGFKFDALRWHSNKFTSVDIDNETFIQAFEFIFILLRSKDCCKCSRDVYVSGNIEVRISESDVVIRKHVFSHSNYFPATEEDINSNIIYLKERFML